MVKAGKCLGTALVLLLLQACGGEEVVLPEVQPLQASAEQLQQLGPVEAGPYEVVTQRDIVFQPQAEQRELALSVFYPAAEERFPLLLFSHGNWSTRDDYDNVIKHWVSHGYVVIAPDHLDCCGMMSGIINSVRYGQVGLIEARTDDFTVLLDNLDALQQQLPALATRIDSSRVAATGHSFGAFSAQQTIGARAYDPDAEAFRSYRDERIQAVVAISPPGPMFDNITDKSWQEVDQPMLVTTGTWDSNAQFWPDWRAHKMSFDTATAGQNYALIVQGADHYLGNLICRLDRENEPQYDALKMVNAVTTRFLNAYLKDDQEALAFIQSNAARQLTGQFAVIEKR